jgi:hypothetical protein
MDSLVAKYSRPAYAQNEPLDDDEFSNELMNPSAHLSLNFAMPPIAQVRQQLASYRHIATILWSREGGGGQDRMKMLVYDVKQKLT